jgi:thiol-disulfide isomerase/thioredoxin
LRDVRTGEFFSIAGLAPRLVVIEPMATWCTNCRAQQVAAREALATLNNPDIVYISLDVDSIENEADLAAYADGHSFPWRFAVASREVARSLAQEFGDVALAPPAVPSITVAPTGEVTFGFGHRDANQLVAELSALLP